MAIDAQERQVQIAGDRFRLSARDIERSMRRIDPEPITSHFVVVASRRYPPKQVISAVTGLDRADFTTHQARRVLMRLGFVAGRRSESSTVTRTSPRQAGPAEATLAERLRPLAGSWVAIRDGDLLHSADTAQALVSWLSRHGQRADSMYRVPDGVVADTGLAPL